jgi:predicted metal-dependent phosphoesterase TrpH
MTTLRADLHVHTCHSTQSGSLKFLRSRDCYSKPADVYRVARARGMDLVCITDHDSINGALELLDRRADALDVIIGEEITCWLPGTDVEVHIGAYGMTEALHRDVQRLRRNVFDVTGRLREAGVFFALNHLLHFYRGQVALPVYLNLLDAVPGMEVRNGTMLVTHNELCARINEERPGPRRAAIGGSDAHTLRRIGTTWTEAPGATRDEFLSSLQRGACWPGGRHGGVAAVAGDAYGVVGSYVAALIGLGPRDLRGWRRAGCLAFAAISPPIQFMPFAIAAARKHAERRIVSRVTADLVNADRDSLSHRREPRDGGLLRQASGDIESPAVANPESVLR